MKYADIDIHTHMHTYIILHIYIYIYILFFLCMVGVRNNIFEAKSSSQFVSALTSLYRFMASNTRWSCLIVTKDHRKPPPVLRPNMYDEHLEASTPGLLKKNGRMAQVWAEASEAVGFTLFTLVDSMRKRTLLFSWADEFLQRKW